MRADALRFLSRRDYTTTELRARLVDRGYSEAEIEPIVADLTAAGALDDARVAAGHVRTAVGMKGRGRLRVARELAARGLPKDVAKQALAGVQAQDEDVAIRKILTRKKWPQRPSLSERRRMFQHLMRRGFAADAIKRAMGAAESDDDPSDD